MKHLVVTIIIFFSVALLVSAQNIVVKGRVVNKISNIPIPYATVVVWQSSNGTITDIDGNYSLAVSPGVMRLSVSCLGFESKVTEEKILKVGVYSIDILLDEFTQGLNEVTVQANIFRKPEESPVSLRRIGVAEIERNPGANRDISKVVQSFPGVASSVSYRNDLIVRGGGPSENVFYLDGIKIPNLNHFATQGSSGGPVGILNADLIREVDFYSGAFPASKGGVLSSALDMKMIDGNTTKAKRKATLGASEIAFAVDGPLSPNTTYLLSIRRSYLQFLFDALGLPFLPTYNDITIKTKTKINAQNELTFLGIGAYDYNRLNTSANETEEKRYTLAYLPESDQWNYTVGAVYKHFKEHSYRTIAISRNHLYNRAFKYKNNDASSELNKLLDYDSDEIENHLRAEENIRLGLFKLIYGIELDQSTYKNYTMQRKYDNGLSFDDVYQSQLDMFGYGAYMQGSKKSDDQRLTLSFGLRLDGNNYSQETSNPITHLSPRFSAAYQFSGKWFVNGSVGRYYKLPSYTMLGFRDAQGVLVNKENNIGYIKSDQLALGLEYRLKQNAILTLEGFYKHYDNYPFSLTDSVSMASKGADFGVFGTEAVTPDSQGRAFGLELMGRWSGVGGLTFVGAYTLVRSEFGLDADHLIYSSWDNRHIFTFTGSQELKRNWVVGVKWRFLAGAPYTPYDMNKSALVQAWDVQNKGYLNFAAYNTERLSLFHQMDLRIDKSYYFKGWMLGVYLDIQNLYNSKYKQQPDLLLDESGGGAVIVNPEAVPEEQRYLLKEIENVSGTIIPSIGIMVEF